MPISLPCSRNVSVSSGCSTVHSVRLLVAQALDSKIHSFWRCMVAGTALRSDMLRLNVMCSSSSYDFSDVVPARTIILVPVKAFCINSDRAAAIRHRAVGGPAPRGRPGPSQSAGNSIVNRARAIPKPHHKPFPLARSTSLNYSLNAACIAQIAASCRPAVQTELEHLALRCTAHPTAGRESR